MAKPYHDCEYKKFSTGVSRRESSTKAVTASCGWKHLFDCSPAHGKGQIVRTISITGHRLRTTAVVHPVSAYGIHHIAFRGEFLVAQRFAVVRVVRKGGEILRHQLGQRVGQ